LVANGSSLCIACCNIGQGLFAQPGDRAFVRQLLQTIVHRATPFNMAHDNPQWARDHVYHLVIGLAEVLIGPDIDFEQYTHG
jgi:hypothetical protein